MKAKIQIAAMGALLALSVANVSAKAPDCFNVSKSVKAAVVKDKASVLAIVEREVTATPDCACEIVRAAIASSEASKDLVGQIAEVAMTAAPEKMRLIAQCAIAVAPDALAQVQSKLAKFEAAAGDSYSAKGHTAKGGTVEVADATDANPLDFPVNSISGGDPVVGPRPGTPGGVPIVPGTIGTPTPGTPPGGGYDGIEGSESPLNGETDGPIIEFPSLGNGPILIEAR